MIRDICFRESEYHSSFDYFNPSIVKVLDIDCDGEDEIILVDHELDFLLICKGYQEYNVKIPEEFDFQIFLMEVCSPLTLVFYTVAGQLLFMQCPPLNSETKLELKCLHELDTHPNLSTLRAYSSNLGSSTSTSTLVLGGLDIILIYRITDTSPVETETAFPIKVMEQTIQDYSSSICSLELLQNDLLIVGAESGLLSVFKLGVQTGSESTASLTEIGCAFSPPAPQVSESFTGSVVVCQDRQRQHCNCDTPHEGLIFGAAWLDGRLCVCKVAKDELTWRVMHSIQTSDPLAFACFVPTSGDLSPVLAACGWNGRTFLMTYSDHSPSEISSVLCYDALLHLRFSRGDSCVPLADAVAGFACAVRHTQPTLHYRLTSGATVLVKDLPEVMRTTGSAVPSAVSFSSDVVALVQQLLHLHRHGRIDPIPEPLLALILPFLDRPEAMTANDLLAAFMHLSLATLQAADDRTALAIRHLSSGSRSLGHRRTGHK